MLRLYAVVSAVFMALPAWSDAKITVLMDVMQVAEVVHILRDEGLQYGATLDEEMLDGEGGEFWAEQVRRLYDPQRMEMRLRRAFTEVLSAEDVEASIAFYASGAGMRIIESENRTRAALADPAVLEAAGDLLMQLRDDDASVLTLIERYIEVNDLVGNNVSGSMSQHYRFLKGLSDGGYGQRRDDQLLDEVWQRRDIIVADTEDWLMRFLTLAYSTLPEKELQSLIVFSESDAGRALNSALFLGFERIYRDISYGLGRGIALNAKADEI